MATIVLEGRIDPKDFASILYAYTEQGVVFSNKSEALRQMLHDFALTLRQAGAKKFDTKEDAMNYLLSIGMGVKPSKSISKALEGVKPHVAPPEEPLDLTPDELENLFSDLLDKDHKL